jgi:hypothetical protein
MHVPAIPRPGRIGQFRATTTPHGVQVHWGTAAHAVRYLFEYILSSEPGRVFSGLITNASLGVTHAKKGTRLTIGVVGVAAGGRSGPPSVARFVVR